MYRPARPASVSLARPCGLSQGRATASVQSDMDGTRSTPTGILPPGRPAAAVT